jgi:hypothetical protein
MFIRAEKKRKNFCEVHKWVTRGKNEDGGSREENRRKVLSVGPLGGELYLVIYLFILLQHFFS